mmetsp:Transcript_17473/g.38080  ORF Transcript_17473/g.38080 Transcript_17473/m.38080 type:complete len:220 (+) Transcript_17473:1459-2118(+)
MRVDGRSAHDGAPSPHTVGIAAETASHSTVYAVDAIDDGAADAGGGGDAGAFPPCVVGRVVVVVVAVIRGCGGGVGGCLGSEDMIRECHAIALIDVTRPLKGINVAILGFLGDVTFRVILHVYLGTRLVGRSGESGGGIAASSLSIAISAEGFMLLLLLLLRSRKIRIPTGINGRILRCGNAVIPTGLIGRLILAVVLVEVPVERGRARGGIRPGIQQR